MLVRTIPHLLRHRTAVIQIHTHTLLLRTLPSEDIRRDRLLDLSLAKQHLLIAVRLASLDLDDLATSDHTDMLKLDLKRVVGQH